jgi:hypothetical protein
VDVDLFNVDGRLMLLDGGQLVTVTKNILAEIISKYVVTKRLVNRGTASQ